MNEAGMTSTGLAGLLPETKLASSLASVLMLMLRKPARSTFSPGVPMQCGVVTPGNAPGPPQMASPGNEPCP